MAMSFATSWKKSLPVVVEVRKVLREEDLEEEDEVSDEDDLKKYEKKRREIHTDNIEM